VLLDEPVQISLAAMFENQVEVVRGLLEVHQFNDVLVPDNLQGVQFLVDALQVFLGQVLETDLLHCIDLALRDCLEYGGVGAFADWTQKDVRSHFSALLNLLFLLHITIIRTCD